MKNFTKFNFLRLLFQESIGILGSTVDIFWQGFKKLHLGLQVICSL